MKATWTEGADGEHQLFKDPVTDDGSKKSAKGRVGVRVVDGVPTLLDQMEYCEWEQMEGDLLETVWFNGVSWVEQNLEDIRANVRAEVANVRGQHAEGG